MGQTYNHLSLRERVEIDLWRKAGRSLRWIGLHLGRSAATISREVSRNAKPTKHWRGVYEGERAHALAQRRRRWDARFKLARQPALRALVRQSLAMGHSPEQIAGRLALEHGRPIISPESIYRFVYHRSAQKDHWHRLLPRHKSRRGRLGRRGGSPGRLPPPPPGPARAPPAAPPGGRRARLGRRGGSPASFIRHLQGLAHRPPEADSRREEGHWEADLMAFSRYGQYVLVLHERCSRLLVVDRLPNKTAGAVPGAAHPGRRAPAA